MTAVTQQDPQVQRRLQQDSILLGGKTIYLNPFLYWRRFDANTDRWLREPGQLQEEQILANRGRFYPEVHWEELSDGDRQIKDGAVEMFIKSLELISTFHPDLSAGHLLEVERKMAVTKKRAFERWVEKSLQRRQKLEQRERRRFDRERALRGWGEWFSLDMTRQALLPFTAAARSGRGGRLVGGIARILPGGDSRARDPAHPLNPPTLSWASDWENGPMVLASGVRFRSCAMAADPFDALRLSLMEDLLPVGIAVVDRARRGGPRQVVEAFTATDDPLAQLRQEGDAAAKKVRESLDQVQPGLGNPVVKVEVRDVPSDSST